MTTEDVIFKRQWFYRFELPSGRTTEPFVPEEVADIHPTRIQMIQSVLDPIYQDTFHQATILDLACNQGYFALHFAQKGYKHVLGLEARESLIQDAQMIREVKGLTNISFGHADVTKSDLTEYGQFDIVLMMGLIYHLEDPIGAIRKASEVTKHVLLLETQVCPGISGTIDWGTYRRQEKIHGVFSIIDETDQLAIPLAGITGIALCPSIEAVIWILEKTGFAKVEIVPVTPGGNEQLASGKRVMVAAYKKDFHN